MRVLHVVPGISPAYGGPSVALTSLARCLTAHGVQTTLATTDLDPHGRLSVALNREVQSEGVRCIFYHPMAATGRFGFVPGLVGKLRGVMASCDVVHIHWLYNFMCIAAARAAIGARVPFVVQPNGSLDPHLRRKNHFVKNLYLKTAARQLVRRADAFVFTCEQERQLARYGARRPEWIVPVGLERSSVETLPPKGTFRAAYPNVRGPFVLFLGRLSRQKGLDLLIDAFGRVGGAMPDLSLVIAGPDAEGYGDQLRTRVKELGIEHRVVFTGMLSHELKLAAFVDATLFCLPSYAENFGAVITEALACGLPVVISNQVNIYREIADAGAGTIVSCSVDSVAAGLDSTLRDAGLRHRMAEAGRTLVRTEYTWDAIVPALISRYESLVRPKRARQGGTGRMRTEQI